jgi:hypothetical protein
VETTKCDSDRKSRRSAVRSGAVAVWRSTDWVAVAVAEVQSDMRLKRMLETPRLVLEQLGQDMCTRSLALDERAAVTLKQD